MKYEALIHITAGLLQLGVAFYALSLGRRLQTRRVAGLLFSGLSLLALAYLLLPFSSFLGGVEWRIEADMLCAMTSILLVIGVRHFDGRLKQLLQRPAVKLVKPQPQLEVESQADSPTMKSALAAAAEAQQKVARLESELAESSQTKAALEKNYLESKAQAQELIAANEELRQTLTVLQAERSEQNRVQELAERIHQDQLAAARHAGIADATAPVILHLKGVLTRINSLSRTADHLAKSRIAPLVQLTRTISGGHRKNGATVKAKSEDRKNGKAKAPVAVPPDRSSVTNSLPWIAREISAEQILLQRKIDSLKRKLESFNETLAIQQSMDKLSRVADTHAFSIPATDSPQTPSSEPAQQIEQLNATAEETQKIVLGNGAEPATELPESSAVAASEGPAEPIPVNAPAPAVA